jgi:hypothetical protein
VQDKRHDSLAEPNFRGENNETKAHHFNASSTFMRSLDSTYAYARNGKKRRGKVVKRHTILFTPKPGFDETRKCRRGCAARQHKTDAIGKGLAEARDVEFEGHAESSAQRMIAQIAQPRVRDTRTATWNSPAQRTIAQIATSHKYRWSRHTRETIPQPRVRDTRTEAYTLS